MNLLWRIRFYGGDLIGGALINAYVTAISPGVRNHVWW